MMKPSRMGVVLVFWVATLLLSSASTQTATDLPLEVRIDLLQTEIIEKLKAEDWPVFLSKLTKLRQLGVEPSHEIIYWEAVATKGLGTDESAILASQILADYLSGADRTSLYYATALGLYPQYENEAKQAKLTIENAAKRKLLIQDSPYGAKNRAVVQTYTGRYPGIFLGSQDLTVAGDNCVFLTLDKPGGRDIGNFHAIIACYGTDGRERWRTRLPDWWRVDWICVVNATQAITYQQAHKIKSHVPPPQAGDVVVAVSMVTKGIRQLKTYRFGAQDGRLFEENTISGKAFREGRDPLPMMATLDGNVLVAHRGSTSLFNKSGKLISSVPVEPPRNELRRLATDLLTSYQSGQSRGIVARQGNVLHAVEIKGAGQGPALRARDGNWIGTSFVTNDGRVYHYADVLRQHNIAGVVAGTVLGNALLGTAIFEDRRQIISLSAEGKVIWISTDNKAKTSDGVGRYQPLLIGKDTWFEIRDTSSSGGMSRTLYFHHPKG